MAQPPPAAARFHVIAAPHRTDLFPDTSRRKHRAVAAGLLIAVSLSAGCAAFVPSSLHTASRADKPASSDAPPTDRIAATGQPRGLLTAAPPFAWQTGGRTDAGQPLEIVTIGRGGFRTLLVGSVGGHDPAAVRLTEKVARYLHRNQAILGGIFVRVIRTLNPDGQQRRQYTNADRIYLNSRFPSDGRIPAGQSLPKEVQFLFRQVQDLKPQRILHLRTIPGDQGLIAASPGAAESARDAAQWLGFRLKSLPDAVRDGTLEAWAARRPDCDMITVAIPASTDPGDVWPLYGDAILSLLLDGSADSRRMAREQEHRQARQAQRFRRSRAAGSAAGSFHDDTAFDEVTAPRE